jgi:hypothetical protein
MAVVRVRTENALQTLLRRTFPASHGEWEAVRIEGLPLPFVDADGRRVALADSLAEGPTLAVAGSAFDTWLVLMQAMSDSQGLEPAVLYANDIDDDQVDPSALLAGWIAALTPAGQGLAQLALRMLRGNRQREPAPRFILLHGLHDLSADRRMAWCRAISALAGARPGWRFVVALPTEQVPPDGFPMIWFDNVSAALADSWLVRLFSTSANDRVRQAIGPLGALRGSAHSPFELLLLAVVVPVQGIPPSRDHLHFAFDDALRRGEIDTARQTTIGRMVLDRLRRYITARELVEMNRFHEFNAFPEAERRELVTLAATLMEHPEPLYRALWNHGRPDPGTMLRAMLRCPPSEPVWPLFLACRLTSGQHTDPAISVHTMRRLLIAAIASAVRRRRPPRRLLRRLLTQLPDAIAMPLLIDMTYAAGTPAAIAWDCADMLIERGGHPNDVPDLRGEPLTRWVYVRACASHPSRAQVVSSYRRAALRDVLETGGIDRAVRTWAGLLADEDLALETRLEALATLARLQTPHALAAIAAVVAAPQPELRAAAFRALARHDPRQTLELTDRYLRATRTPWEVRIEMLSRLASVVPAAVVRLVLFIISDTSIPLHARLERIADLRASEDEDALLGIATTVSHHPEVRAAAARTICSAGSIDAIRALLQMLRADETPRALRAAICEGLAAENMRIVGDRAPVMHRLISRTLAALLGAWRLDSELTIAAVRAFGRHGGTRATSLLQRLTGVEARARLFQIFDEDPRKIAPDPDDRRIPAPIALRVMRMVVESATPADRPTSMAEFFRAEADRVRIAAAETLVMIDSAGARAALRRALVDGITVESAAALARAYISAETDDEAVALTLGDAEIGTMIRWRVVQACAAQDRGAALRLALERPALEHYLRCEALMALGACTDNESLRMLVRVVRDQSIDQTVRGYAITALNRLNEPAAEAALLPLIESADEDITIRAQATRALPPMLSRRTAEVLHRLVHAPIVPEPLLIAALTAIRAVPHPVSIGALLRHSLDARDQVVIAAIEGLVATRDLTVVPAITRVAGDTARSSELRIRAAGAIARLGDREGISILQWVIDHDALSLQLQALNELHHAGSHIDINRIVIDSARPVPLRMRAIASLQRDSAACDALLAVVINASDILQVRCAAARMLESFPARPDVLTPIIANRNEPAEIRVRCIETLRHDRTARLRALFSEIAEDPGETPAVRAWAIIAIGGTGLLDSHRDVETTWQSRS